MRWLQMGYPLGEGGAYNARMGSDPDHSGLY